MPERFKIGIIGLTANHANRLDQLKNHITQLEIIAAHAESHQDILFAKNDARIAYCYDDPQKLADNNELDGIFIWSEVPLHARHAIIGIEANKSVLVRLPIASNLGDAQDMVKAAKRRPSQASFAPIQHLHNPMFKKAFQLIEDGIVGIPMMFQVNQSFVSQTALNDQLERNYRNLFLGRATDTIGLIEWLIGKKIIALESTGAVAGDSSLLGTNDVDIAQVQCKLSGGCFGQFSFSSVGHNDSLSITIQGSSAKMKMDHSGLYIINNDGQVKIDVNNHLQNPLLNDLSIWSSFAEQIKTRSRPENDIDAALSATAVSVAMAKSALMKEKIKLNI